MLLLLDDYVGVRVNSVVFSVYITNPLCLWLCFYYKWCLFNHLTLICSFV
jgi:hypothetical protein